MANVIKLKNNTYLYGTILSETSNENGHAIKFTNGTMIQFVRIEKGNIDYTTPFGSAYINSNNQHITLWTFPEQFVNKPEIVAVSCGGNSYMSSSVNDWTRSTATLYTTSPASATIRSVFLTAVAIGRWKL